MRPVAILFAALLLAVPAHADKARKPRPADPADKYPMHETHKDEHVTIAAEPGDTKDTRPDTRLDYFHHGFMPVRVIITNDSDKPLSLDDARIQFVTADNTVIPAATPDELQRRLFSRKSSEPTKIPLIPITIKKEPVDQKITNDDFDFGFISTTVDAHSTAAGYLYYDVRDVAEPVLKNATLEIRRVHPVGVKQEFYSFEIPLRPTDEPAKPDSKAPAQTKIKPMN